MGIDAMMLVKVPSDTDVDHLAFDLQESFGSVVNTRRPSRRERGGGFKSLRPLLGHRYGIDVAEGELLLEVMTQGRYYAPFYERGVLHDYLAIADWLGRRVPGCTVYYGSHDHGDVEELTAARREELWAHFVRVGHRPYERSGDHAPVSSPKCDFCDQRMTGHVGSGGTFTCTACGWNVIVDDEGRLRERDPDTGRWAAVGDD